MLACINVSLTFVDVNRAKQDPWCLALLQDQRSSVQSK